MNLIPSQHQGIQEVSCLYVPMRGPALLIPMSAVAEVIQTLCVIDQDDAPVWFDGWLEWRQKRVPLISFEALESNESQTISENSSALVINSLSIEKGLSYYALQVQGFSNLIRIAEDDPLQIIDHSNQVPYVSMEVELDGRHMMIPDLQSLEAYLAENLQALLKKS